jgi:hypothetical protein
MVPVEKIGTQATFCVRRIITVVFVEVVGKANSAM